MKTVPTSRLLPALLALLLVSLIATSTARAEGDHGHVPYPLVDPRVDYRGQSFDEWMALWYDWFFRTEIGGEDLPDTVNGVRLLPVGLDPGTEEFEITVAHGTAFVHSPIAFVGTIEELEDPIVQQFIALFISNATLNIELNGQVLLDGTLEELQKFGFLIFPDPPLFGFEFILGIGQIYQPLPVGEHTLVVEINDPIFGQSFTCVYHITVLLPVLHFHALGTGDQEVPPVETRAHSFANLSVVTIFGQQVLTTIRFDQRLSSRVIAAHIHLAPPGTNGPPVITYDLPLFELFGFALSLDFHTSADLEGPLAGKTLIDLVKEIQEGDTYINVHTVRHPPGEVRGQIE